VTRFLTWNKKVGVAAIFEAPQQMSNREVTLDDETIDNLVDAGLTDVAFVFQNGRWMCKVDDWVDQPSEDGLRTIHLTMMDRI